MIVLVLVVAFILRFWQLSSLPPAVDWDEASTAYNAYSILKTGRDEYGKSFPFLFRAFDGYVPPALIYLNVPSIKIFGLNALGARVPNATLGTLSIFGLYLLMKRFSDRKLAGLSALFLAISPWYVTYSRVDFFATLPIFFLVFATYFFFLSFSKKWSLLASIVFFTAAVFSYFSAYVFVPLFTLSLAFFYRRRLGIRRIFLFTAPILAFAVFILFFAPGGQARLKGVSAFSDPDLIKKSAMLAKDDGFVGKILYNRRLVYGERLLEGYFANFRFGFLFGKADTVSRMVVPGEGFGLMYLWDLPFLLSGIYFLILKKPTFWKLILVWLALSPVASAATLPQMTSTRASIMVIPLVVISAWGFYCFGRSKQFLKSVLIGLLAANFFIFGYSYFAHFSKEKSAEWFYGYRELFGFLDGTKSHVYFFFKQHESLDQVHIFNLFYNKVDPSAWRVNGGTKLGCGSTTGQLTFGRYHFVPYSCLESDVDLDSIRPEDLVVTSMVLSKAQIKTIYFLDGEEAFFVYRYKDINQQLKGVLLRPLL